VTVGEGELASTGTEAEAEAEAEAESEAEDVPAGDAELVGVVLAAGFGVLEDVALAVGLGAVADGDVVGTGEGETEDGVVAGVTIAAGGGQST
jgi:hypothetical protein